MKVNIARKIIWTIIFSITMLILSNIQISAQSFGKITGMVVDEEFGEGLIGVNVMIKGTTQGAATDLNGKFTIGSVKPGNYTVIISMIGYTRQVIKDVRVQSNQIANIETVLKTESIETEEVIITAKALMNTEATLLSKRQKSIEVSDAVSSEQFSKMGSSNAADAAKQIVGASVVNGRDVYVRGLGDRYTSTSLNGAKIPSANPYKRSGSIDIIPSNLIDNIQAVKSFTPDKPGDFSGGAVDVRTKDFPEKFNLSTSFSTKTNSEITFNNSGLTYTGGSTDWLGFDDGTRALPSIIGNNTWSSNVGAAQKDDNLAQKIDDVTKSFNSQMSPENKGAPVNQSYSLSLGNEYNLFGKQLGFIASLTYKNEHSGYIGGEINRWDRGVADPNKTQLDTNFAMADTKSISEVVVGGLAKLSMKINANNSLSFNFLYNQNGVSTSRFVNGKYPYDIDASWDYQARTLLYQERNLLSYQLVGNHSLESLGNLKIDWIASLMSTNQSDPDNRFFYNYKTDRGVYGVKTNLPPERYFRNTDETQDKLGLNFNYPINLWNGKISKLKFGGAYLHSKRDFNERRFVYNPVTSVGRFLRNENGSVDALFSDKYLGWTSQDTLRNGTTINRFSMYVTETDQTSSNYSGRNDISAGYAMIDLPVTDNIRLITGARFESTNMLVVSKKEGIEDGKIKTNDILPSLSVIYNPIQNMNIRFSYGKTLARPSFREISPFQNYDFNGGDTYVGNPNLQRTLIDNLDLRWEWFTNPGEVVSVSLFAKKFTDPIELKIVDAPNKVISWTNVDQAKVYGFEFETRRKIDFLSTLNSSFQLGGNFSLIYSKVDIDPTELEKIRTYEPDASSTRQFQGQSPYLVNIYVDYENRDLGFTTSVYYNVYGKRLASVGSLGTPDVFEKPSNQLNLSVTKSLFENLRLKVNVENLLNSAFVKIQEFKGNEYIYSKFLRGRSLSVELNYKI